MATQPYQPSKLRRTLVWGDIRKRRLGMIAYVLNRITGIGLVAYLYLHLIILSMLAGGPGSWDPFVTLAKSPAFLALDVVLIAGWLIHGLNGVRVGLNGFGIGVRAQKAMFVGLMVVAVIGIAAMALAIFVKG
jgi:succinate dehydrogenase / fumarate reductase cytochrome b subunit